MRRTRSRKLNPILLLLAALLLRATVPAGFMPAATGSGLLYEFCPDGISAEFVQYLAGTAGHDHGADAHHDTANSGDDCSFGDLVPTAAFAGDLSYTVGVDSALLPATNVARLVGGAALIRYRSRAPPA